jgi:hypothetical protein
MFRPSSGALIIQKSKVHRFTRVFKQSKSIKINILKNLGQNLRLASCLFVNEENNFGLHQFFERPILSEKETTSLCALIADLCLSCYKCAHTLQNIQSDRDTLERSLWKLKVVKAVTYLLHGAESFLRS